MAYVALTGLRGGWAGNEPRALPWASWGRPFGPQDRATEAFEIAARMRDKLLPFFGLSP